MGTLEILFIIIIIIIIIPGWVGGGGVNWHLTWTELKMNLDKAADIAQLDLIPEEMNWEREVYL